MADSKLTVSLILNSASFTKQLQDINKTIKLNESEFKALSSSVSGFSNTLSGAQAKVNLAKTNVEQTSKKMDVYKNSIKNTETELNKLTTRYDENNKKLTTAKQKYTEVCSTMGKNSTEAKDLKKEIKSLEEEKSKLENRIVGTNNKLTGLQTELNNTTAKFNGYNEQLRIAEEEMNNFNVNQGRQALLKFGEDMEALGTKMSNIGKSMSQLGTKLTMGLTVPLTAVGTYIAKTSMNFEQSMAKVSSVSGATGDELKKLEDTAKKMGETTKFSASESADAMYYMGLAGWKSQEMIDGIPAVLSLAAAGNLDLAKASDIVTDNLTALGLGAEDAGRYVDVMAATMTNSNTTVEMMGESMNYAAPIANTLGINMEDLSVSIGLMANAGIKASSAGTALRTGLLRLNDPPAAAAEAMDKYGISLKTTDDGAADFQATMVDMRKKLGKLDETTQAAALSAIFGKNSVAGWAAICNASTEDFDSLTEAIKNSDGVAQNMADTLNNTTQGQLTLLKSKIEGLAIKLGKVLLPMINNLMDGISKLVDKFSSLNPETQEAIVKAGLWAAALGPCLKILGGITQFGGGVIKIVGKLSTAMAGSTAAAAAAGGAATSAAAATTAAAGASTAAAGAAAASATGFGAFAAGLGGVVVAAAPWLLAGAAVAGTGYAIHKAMNESATPAVDLFADKVVTSGEVILNANGELISNLETTTTTISEKTQEAVQAYLNMDQGVTTALQEMQINSSKITIEMAEDLVGQYHTMGTTIRDGIQTQCNEQTEIISGFFAKSTALSQEAEAEILQNNTKYYTDKKQNVTDMETEIQSIIEAASRQQRTLKEDEVARIQELQQQMKTNAVLALSEQESEAFVILERMKNYDENITAEMVSEHIKKLNEQRDNAISAAEEEYAEVVKNIKYMRDETGSLSEEQANKLLEEAERQRKGVVDKAEETRKDAVDKIFSMNKDIANDVDQSSGKVISVWDRLFGKWDKWTPAKKVVEIEQRTWTSSVTGNTVSLPTPGAYPFGASAPSATPTGSFSTGSTSLAAYAPAVQTGIQTMSDTISTAAKSVYTPSKTDLIRMSNSLDTNKNQSYQQNDNSGEILSALQTQNELLTKMILSMSGSDKDVNVSLAIDGKQIAKATARYMEDEINTITRRKSRLGGAF